MHVRARACVCVCVGGCGRVHVGVGEVACMHVFLLHIQFTFQYHNIISMVCEHKKNCFIGDFHLKTRMFLQGREMFCSIHRYLCSIKNKSMVLELEDRKWCVQAMASGDPVVSKNSTPFDVFFHHELLPSARKSLSLSR